MSPARTAAQEKAVLSDQREICVTAGAGSGKTRVLVERFAHLVLNKEIPVEAILAITFTEKAAADMKERIARAFEEAGAEEERRKVEFSYISTIDAFCARLLRENALEAGVDPRFRVLSEIEAERLMREAADTILLAHPQERLFDLVEATRIPDLSASLRALYKKIRHAGMPLSTATLEPVSQSEIGEEILSEGLRELGRAKRLERLTPKQEEMIQSLSGLSGEIASLPADASPAEVGRSFKLFRSRFVFHGTKERPVLQGALKRIEEGLNTWRSERLERAAGPLRATLGELLPLFEAEYRRQKNGLATLDFADLEWLARDLLSRSSEVRQRLQRRFRHVFLDEFQDTNPLQKEIVDQLRGGHGFLVAGDAKQSIYGFRDADVALLATFQRSAEASGGHIPLPENFRSRPELVEFSNRLFSSSLWKPGPVPFSPMVAAAAHDSKPFPSVEILMAEGENAESARIREAEALSGRIAELVEEGGTRITRQESQRHGQPISYGDLAILFRSTTHMRIYERALAHRRIPYFVQEGRGYFRAQEVRDLASLLRALENPRDDFHLAAVLRSPLCGLSDDDLYRLARRESSRSRLADRLRQASGLSGPGRERLASFVALFDRIRGRKGRGPLWRALEEVLSETSIGLQALLHFNGRRRLANLKKLMDLVRTWEAAQAHSLPALVELLEDYGAEEARESEAMVESPRDDTVKLMTIHAAKGLEFPLVAVADLGRSEPPRRTEEIFRRGEGMGLAFYDPQEGSRSLKPASYLALEDRQKEAELQEENRLLYVAVTRAQEHLMLSGWSASSARGSDSWLKAIEQALGGEQALAANPLITLLKNGNAQPKKGRMASLAGLQRDRLEQGQPLVDDPAIQEAAGSAREIQRRASLASPALETTPFMATATEIVQHQLCPRRYHLRYRIGAPSGLARDLRRMEPEGSRQVREMGPSGADLEGLGSVKDDELPAEKLGDRVHRILAEPEGSPLINDLLASLSSKEQKEARQQVETFWRSDLGSRVRTATTLREVPFAMTRLGATLRGQIDLVIEPGSTAMTLVDYKTSRIPASEVKEKAADYELQLRLYALAALEIFGEPPQRACLYFLHPDAQVDVDLSPSALEAAEGAIKAFFAAHQTGSFPQRPASHCYSCGYLRYYCPGLVIPDSTSQFR
jgi:ATP-dependent helicase/nuclease subunit A